MGTRPLLLLFFFCGCLLCAKRTPILRFFTPPCYCSVQANPERADGAALSEIYTFLLFSSPCATFCQLGLSQHGAFALAVEFERVLKPRMCKRMFAEQLGANAEVSRARRTRPAVATPLRAAGPAARPAYVMQRGAVGRGPLPLAGESPSVHLRYFPAFARSAATASFTVT